MATRIDPYGQFNFLLQIDGVTQAGFSEVSGLTTDTNIIEYREGADNIYGVNTVRKLVGLNKIHQHRLQAWLDEGRKPLAVAKAPCSTATRSDRTAPSYCSTRRATRC